MARNPDSPRPHGPYLREWREHRGYTQAQVVAFLEGMEDPKLPTTTASLSRLENGKQPYSQPVLEALAHIYGTEAGNLLDHNPKKEGEVIDFLAKLDEAQQKQLLAIAQALVSSSG